MDDIKATYGDSTDKEQTSAYMLMYRRYDEQNVLPFLKTELPEHIIVIKNNLCKGNNFNLLNV